MFTDVVGVLWVGFECDLGGAEGTFLSVSFGLLSRPYELTM